MLPSPMRFQTGEGAGRESTKERAVAPRATPEGGVAQTSETFRSRVEPAGISGDRQRVSSDGSLQPAAGSETTISTTGGPVKCARRKLSGASGA